MGITVLLITTFLAWVTVMYLREIKEARERLEDCQTSTVQTTYGQITYMEHGTGQPVLIVHGICGGYDQAIETSKGTFGENYRTIAPSRFGYPGSDLPAASTPRDQAAAFAELLDYLKLEQVVVLATSAGGAPAFRFAQDYPHRTKALILLSSGVPTPETPTGPVGPPAPIYTNFVMWAALKAAKQFLLKMFGIDKDAYRAAAPSEKRGIEALFATMLPIGIRRPGIFNDLQLTIPDMNLNYREYNLENLHIPTLIIHAKDDPMASYTKVAAAQARIPNSTLLSFEKGGHVIFGSGTQISQAIDKYIKALEP